MWKSLSFGQKIGLGFAAVVFFTLLVGGIALYALRTVIADKDRVITTYAQNLINAANLATEAEQRVSFTRGFLLGKEDQFLIDVRESREDCDKLVSAIRRQIATSEEEQTLVKIEQASRAQISVTDRIIEQRKADLPLDKVIQQFQADVVPKNKELRKTIADFVQFEEQLMDKAKTQATESATLMTNFMIGIALAGIVVAMVLALVLSRMLSRQIGSAVQHIRSSSTELQTAAGQQTTGSREQATAMSEIATTIKELVATARQIAESAQRVAGIAEEAARGARSGDQTMQKAQDAVGNIKRQVDTIVTHMLELGRKSQQIGGILDVINELAEQTNILAINASIEAAGAGDAGRRFAVVADEIRKLADRVGGSTREIKGLVEEIRSAVHTTVMATESGSKAVDAGTRQFGDVSVAFQQILRLVETTMEAAREIELSTKQQTTAVGQVNEAIGNVAQASRESEVSSAQTLQTVTELTALSRDLERLVQPQATA